MFFLWFPLRGVRRQAEQVTGAGRKRGFAHPIEWLAAALKRGGIGANCVFIHS